MSGWNITDCINFSADAPVGPPCCEWKCFACCWGVAGAIKTFLIPFIASSRALKANFLLAGDGLSITVDRISTRIFRSHLARSVRIISYGNCLMYDIPCWRSSPFCLRLVDVIWEITFPFNERKSLRHSSSRQWKTRLKGREIGEEAKASFRGIQLLLRRHRRHLMFIA